jgi:hypothetical protein
MTWRVLVTGSREFTDYDMLAEVLAAELAEHPDMIVVHGDCPSGLDALAKRWCVENGVAQEPHPADWRRLGKSAGFRRNTFMAGLGARRCHAFPLPGSRGTLHCMKVAKRAGIPVNVHKKMLT